VLAPNRVALGAYDPNQELSTRKYTIDHVFLNDRESNQLATALKAARDRHILMATIEMDRVEGSPTATLESVVTGQHDAALRKLASLIHDAAPSTVLVRWGQEMDLIDLYPWSVNDPALFRAAFRHIVSVFRDAGAVNARWVWSPAGTDLAPAFFPGSDVVDYIGLTILGDASWDAIYNLPPQTFAEILDPRYKVVAPLGKPVLIAELGVSGSVDRQAQWLSNAVDSLTVYPLVEGLVYFDAINAPNNHRATQPDWRLTTTVFDRLSRSLLALGTGDVNEERRQRFEAFEMRAWR
jgi:endoglucanase